MAHKSGRESRSGNGNAAQRTYTYQQEDQKEGKRRSVTALTYELEGGVGGK